MLSIKSFVIIALLCVEFFVSAVRQYDEVEYDLSTTLLNTWEIGNTITFTLPHNVDVIGTITLLQKFSDQHFFISGDVPNNGWFQASYYEDTLNANVAYPGNVQYELRPTVINKSISNTKKTYKMRDVNVNDEYFAKDVELDSSQVGDAFGNETIVTLSQSAVMKKQNVQAMKKQNVPVMKKQNGPVVQKSVMQRQGIKLAATTELKLLILYTKDAVIASGSETNLLATITLAVGNFNAALRNSLIDVNVVYVAERIVEYDTYLEGVDTFSTMLNSMGSSISTARRYIVGAHAVQLIVKNTAYCGLGNYNFNGQTGGNSVAYYGCIGGYLSLAHEVSHNIGLHHDIQTYTGVGTNHGSCWDDTTGTTCKRSVLAYAGCITPSGRTNCDRVQYFSNPNVNINGMLLGDATISDNAQQFRNNIQTFTNLYTMAPIVAPTVAPTNGPVPAPSFLPTLAPIMAPTGTPVTAVPTGTPVTAVPTIPQTFTPSAKPVFSPSKAPIVATNAPFKKGTKPPPTLKPTIAVYDGFSAEPTVSSQPTYEPSVGPSEPTISPANSTDLGNGIGGNNMTVVYSVVFVLIALFIIVAVFCALYWYHKPSANNDDDINDHSHSPDDPFDYGYGGGSGRGKRTSSSGMPMAVAHSGETSVSTRGIYTGTSQTTFSTQQDEQTQNRLRQSSATIARASNANNTRLSQPQQTVRFTHGQRQEGTNEGDDVIDEEGDEDDEMGERMDSTRLLPTDINISTGGIGSSTGRSGSFRSNKNNISSKIGAAITSVVDNISSSSSTSAKPQDMGYSNI